MQNDCVFQIVNLKNSDTIIYYLLCILYYLKVPYDLTWLDRLLTHPIVCLRQTGRPNSKSHEV